MYKISILVAIVFGQLVYGDCPNLNGVFKQCKIIESTVETEFQIPADELALVEYHIKSMQGVDVFLIQKKWRGQPYFPLEKVYDHIFVGETREITFETRMDITQNTRFTSACNDGILTTVQSMKDTLPDGSLESTKLEKLYSLDSGKLKITETSYYDGELDIAETYECQK